MGLVLYDLAALGFGYNPAIPAAVHHDEPPFFARLRQGCGAGGRVLGIGEELPPNVLMRFGLHDIRNYDSVELEKSLRWFAPLYEPSATITSRSEITWERAGAASGLLRESGVRAVVAAAAPQPGLFGHVERLLRVHVAWLDGQPWASAGSRQSRIAVEKDDGWARIRIESQEATKLTIRETFDPGWRAVMDEQPVEIQAESSVFMQVSVPAGEHIVILRYLPVEVKLGVFVSLLSCIILILVLTGIRLFGFLE